MTSETSQLVISTTGDNIPVHLPSSQQSSISSSRSESPVSARSGVNSPTHSREQDREGTSSASYATESSSGSGGSDSGEDHSSPENGMTRHLQKLTLNTLKEPDLPRVKPINVLPTGAHVRPNPPLYSPTKQFTGYLVQKDGQIYGIDTGMPSPAPLSPPSMISSPTGTIYFPTNWTPTISPTASLHLRPVSQQPTPRGEYVHSLQINMGDYVHSPHGMYEYQFLQVPTTQQATTYLASPHPLSPTNLSPHVSPTKPVIPKRSSSSDHHSNQVQPDFHDINGNITTSQSILENSSNNENTKDNKLQEKKKKTSTKAQTQEVPRDMFSASESITSVLGTVTSLSVLPTPAPEVQSLSPQPILNSNYEMKKMSSMSPSYAVNYQYPTVYFDPNTQTFGYPVYPQSYPNSRPLSAQGTPIPTVQPHGHTGALSSTTGLITHLETQNPQAQIGYITDPTLSPSHSPRAVYQLPLTGEWSSQQQQQQPYASPPRSRGSRIRPGFCLFVFHIHPSATDEELYALFSQCGKVLSAKVMRNPQTSESRGYGFINMANQRDGEKAIATFHGYFWKNKYLKVSYKKKRYHSRN